MKQCFGFIQRFMLCVTPLIASCSLGITPSQAATFAYSEAEFNFTNFNTRPLTIGTDTDTYTISLANGGMVDAVAYARANFLALPSRPAQASNLSISEAWGEGRDYLGRAESEARIIGEFIVDANKYFSFDFITDLIMETSIDDSSAENATAFGDTYFALIDNGNNNILDFFNLIGNISTPNDNDFIAVHKSDNVTLNNRVITSNFGGIQEDALVSIQGSLQRYFTKETNLSLVEVKKNHARVVVPEPSTNLAILLCFIGMGFAIKARRKVNNYSGSQSSKIQIKIVKFCGVGILCPPLCTSPEREVLSALDD